MASKQTKYRKLSGRSTLSVQKSYLAEDHLLVVDGHYKETYRRLYFEDIEAILVCPTASGKVIAVIMTILSVCMMLLPILNGLDYLPLAIILGIIPAIFAVALFYGGGSVLFGVQTAVQLAVLNGVNSQRKANKARRMLVAEVERVQGGLSASILQAGLKKDTNREKGSVQREEGASIPPPSEDSQIRPSYES